VRKPGFYTLKASSPFGTAASNGFDISNTSHFTVTGQKTVHAGSRFGLTIVARKPTGAHDLLYQGSADLFIDREKIASGVAVNGVARFNVTSSKPGRTLLIVRDQLNRAVIGKTVVIVVQ
jgi:hypothetical protein